MPRDSVLILQTLREFSRYLEGGWAKETVLVDLVQILHEVIGCSRASAYLFEEGTFSLSVTAGEPVELGAALNAQKPEELPRLFDCNGNSCEVQLRDGSYVLPLVCNDVVYGAIAFQLPSLSKGLADTISILGTLASVGFKNLAQAEEKKVIDSIVSNFASGLDMNVYYPQFARQIKRIIPFERLTITIPNPFNKKELMVYSLGKKQELVKSAFVCEGTATAWIVSTGEYIIEEDLSLQRMFVEDDYLFDLGIRCALRVPLTSKGKVIGALNVGSVTPCSYTARDIKFFGEIAGRIGPAVENALIYEAVNSQLIQALMQLENNFTATLNALTVLLDKRDVGTKGHCLRVVGYAEAIGAQLGLRGIELEDIRLGSLLHDIGKIGIPDSILFKPGKLTEDEWVVMRTHPRLGGEMVERVDFLLPALPIVLHHHEWFNGTGYPDRLKGEEIPLGARIFSIADAFDAMTSDRPYRKALDVNEAVRELHRCNATQFCPACMEAFARIPVTELEKTRNDWNPGVTFARPYLTGQKLIEVSAKKNS